MALDQDTLKRIMGAPDSVTGKLVALRKTPGSGDLDTGVWYSDFTRVHEESLRRGLPFVAMWTNGDLCGFCRRFTKNILEPEFQTWMRDSGFLFWLGGSMDESAEDNRGGKGFKWCIGPDNTVSYFPFFAVVKEGDYGFYGSGHDYDESKKAPEGTVCTLNKIAEITGIPIPIIRGESKAAHTESSTDGKDVSPRPIVSTSRRLSIRFNPEWDRDHILRFQNALKETGGHCPCQVNHTVDTMCMCRAFLSNPKAGMCRCGAFEKYVV